jgi:23S rRNA (adenine-N6)-dimethyltransferase
VAAHGRSPRPSGRASDGQHLLRSEALARELVDRIGVSAGDHVVEIGGGAGALTGPLLRRAGLVTAIEIDTAFARHLERRFADQAHLDVITANALRVELPRRPYRVVGNLPFGAGTRLLRRLLDDVASPLERVDVILQFEAARRLAQVGPASLATLRWAPWWRVELVRRIDRVAFDPPPSVDAGLLTIDRRSPPLLASGVRPAYLRMLETAFRASSSPVRAAASVPRATWRRFADERGLPQAARPQDLDVTDWVAFLALTRRRR